MKQSTALDILKTGQNVFLTGSAGSGKTYTLNQYIHYLRARRVPVAITASTGIAATHMNGITIHSWSGIGIKSEMGDADFNRLSKNKKLRERIKDTAVLIIDEVSMLHAKQLNLVNEVLKRIRGSSKAFGGIQLVLAGDFFQLPPIGERDESNRDKFAFMSEAWLDADFKICYLSEQYRQQSKASTSAVEGETSSADQPILDLSLNDILNQIRRSQVTQQAVHILKETIHNQVNINRTQLYTHNYSVDKINQNELNKLQSESQTYLGESDGDGKLSDMLKKSVRTNDELVLKVGAKVMFIKNISELEVYNGTMGEITGFTKLSEDDEQPFPVVKLNSGRNVIATPEEWMVEDEQGMVLAAYSQVPLALAWAITVHKSQGMTLDAAEIDLSRTFEMGQGYVALSRLKDLAGLKLLGLNDTSLRLDPLARGADKRFIELSDGLQLAHDKLAPEELAKAHSQFVLSSGGTTDSKAIAGYEASQKKRKARLELAQHRKNQGAGNGKNESTLDTTKALLEESLSIAEIAETRGLAQSTIMGHISKLKKMYPELPCQHLCPDDELIQAVKEAYEAVTLANDPNDFSDDGQVKLRPLFEYLQERVSWNDIRLALIFLDD